MSRKWAGALAYGVVVAGLLALIGLVFSVDFGPIVVAGVVCVGAYVAGWTDAEGH